MSDRILSIKNLHVSYGQVIALRGVEIEVLDAEIVCIVGPNGAGKSTLLKTISGMMNAKEGSIRFMEDEIMGKSPYYIARAGIIHVPERRQIFNNMTVWENLMIGGDFRKDFIQIREDLLEIFEKFPILRGRRNQLGGTLSGGEQQILAIARGLMGNPRLLLFDEPSLGLAPLITNEIFNLFLDFKSKKIMVLLVEQNVSKGLQIGDQGYVLSLGRVVMKGPGKALLENTDVLRAYLGTKTISDKA